jgi:hypothetical protein
MGQWDHCTYLGVIACEIVAALPAASFLAEALGAVLILDTFTIAFSVGNLAGAGAGLGAGALMMPNLRSDTESNAGFARAFNVCT